LENNLCYLSTLILSFNYIQADRPFITKYRRVERLTRGPQFDYVHCAASVEKLKLKLEKYPLYGYISKVR